MDDEVTSSLNSSLEGNAVSLQPTSGGDLPISSGEKALETAKKRSKVRMVLLGLSPFIALLVVAAGFIGWRASQNTLEENASVEVITVSLPDDGLLDRPDTSIEESEQVVINGELKANGTVIIEGSSEPTEPVTGQLYFDNTTNEFKYFNGTQFVTISIDEDDVVEIADTLQVTEGGTGATTFALNSLLYGNGTASIQATNVPNAGQLLVANSNGVPTFTTVTGDISINSTGVTSLSSSGVTAGTYGSSNQVAQFTVGADGRITSVTNVSVAGGGGGDILQNGNSFGTAITVGSNDNFNLNFETNGTSRITVQNDGDVAFDTNTLFVDAANNRVGIGNITPISELDVTGDANFSSQAQVGASNSFSECTGVLGNFNCNATLEVGGAFTETTTPSYGIRNFNFLAPGSDNSAANYGISTQNILTGAVNYTGNYYGLESTVIAANTGNINTLNGALITAGSSASGNTTLIRGLGVIAGGSNDTPGIIAEIYGQEIQILGGTLSTTSNAYGLQVTSATGNITNFTGIRIEDQTTATGRDVGLEIEGADTYALWIGSGGDNTGAADGITFGATPATQANLYRGGDNLLITDDALTVAGDLTVNTNSSLILVGGVALPGSPVDGEIFWNSVNEQLLIYDQTNSVWEQLNGNSSATFVVAASDSDRPELADYRADGNSDEVEIQAAIQAALALGGGTVYLMEGNYSISSSIYIRDNIDLVGSGDSTVVRIADGAVGGASTLAIFNENTNPTNISIRYMLIDGNDTNNAGNTRAISLNAVTGGTGTSATKGALIEGITTRDLSQYSIILTNSTNIQIVNSTFVDSGATEIINMNGTTNRVVVGGNEFYAPSLEAINVSSGSPTNIIISNNVFRGAGTSAIDFSGGESTIIGNTFAVNNRGIMFRGNNSTITGNSFISSTRDAIELSSATNVVVSANQIVTFGAGVGDYAIQLTDSDYNLVSGNQISGGGSSAIYIDSTSNDNTITSNNIENITGTDRFIHVVGDNNSIIGNQVSDSAGDTVGIEVDAAANGTYIADNVFNKAAGTDQNVLNSGTNTVIANQVDIAGNIELQATANIELLSNTDITGTLTVSSTATFNGNTVIGNANTDTLSVNAQIDTDITFADGSNRIISVENQTSPNTAGNNLTLQAAAGLGTGAGGVVNINSGNGGITNGAGGVINITSGSGGGGSSSGGIINITGGDGTGFGGGGRINLDAGGLAGITGGSIDLIPGTILGSGSVQITGGFGNGLAAGGAVSITGGSAGGGNFNGGNIILQPGALSGSGTAGSIRFQPQASNDSITFFQVLDADGGTPIINIDSTNERLGVGIAAPTTALHVQGGTAGHLVTVRNTTSNGEFAQYIDDSGNVQFDFSNSGNGGLLVINDNFANGIITLQAVQPDGELLRLVQPASSAYDSVVILSGGDGDAAKVELKEDDGQFGFDLIYNGSSNQLELWSDTGTDGNEDLILTVDRNTGSFLFQNVTDSVAGFRVMDADGGTPVLSVDTTNERVGIGTGTPASSLQVIGDVRIGTGTISFATGSGDLYIQDQLEVDGQSYFTGNLNVLGSVVYSNDTIVIADSGDGSPASHTLEPATSYVEITCNDVDGCNITMGETSPVDGEDLTVVNVSANAINFADTAGVSEIAGAFAAGQYDSIKFIYIGDRWVETSRSDN